MSKLVSASALVILAGTAMGDMRSTVRMDGAIPQFVLGHGLAGKNFISARSPDFPTAVGRSAQGDLYGAATLAQSTASAFFIDANPDTFTFGPPNPELGGANLISGSRTFQTEGQSVDPITGNTVITVAAYTGDSSDMLPAGVTAGTPPLPLTAIRYDVGAFAAVDSIQNVTGGVITAASVVSVSFVLFANGVSLGTFGTAATNFATGLGAVGVVGGAAGAGIDEVQMIFTIVPAPGSFALLGMAGLATARRRRRA